MQTKTIVQLCAAALITSAQLVGGSAALADARHGPGDAVGSPGKKASASRTVEVVMYDNYYEPEAIEVKPGETVRFVVTNSGQLVHEFNIGTPALHVAHQDEMQMMADHGVLMGTYIDHEAAKAMQVSMGHGMHNDPNSVLLEPGKSGEVIWTFPKGGTLEFACNVPGHYDAGMQGDITVGK